MSSEIIHIIAYNNYDGFFDIPASYVHNISFQCLNDFLMTKLILGLRYSVINYCKRVHPQSVMKLSRHN
jgi:hypothetical protein